MFVPRNFYEIRFIYIISDRYRNTNLGKFGGLGMIDHLPTEHLDLDHMLSESSRYDKRDFFF